MRIKFSRLNFETECMWDLINHRGFIITEMPFSDIDKTVRNMNGPRSPRFGSTMSDSVSESYDAFADRYRCECGRSIGAVFEGEECPYCHTKIEYKDVDILYTGWISLNPFHIISPLYYQRLQSALSRKVLENIISNENIITSNGIIRRHDEPVEVKKSMMMYHNIGLA